MLDPMTFDEALEQLRRVARRHEGMKGLLHEIADTLESEHEREIEYYQENGGGSMLIIPPPPGKKEARP
jgi:hypothetical protein